MLAGSVALLAFGLDSVIEGLASVIVVWRFTGSRTLSETAEARAQKAVAVTFFLLAPYIAYDAISTLVGGARAETSWLGNRIVDRQPDRHAHARGRQTATGRPPRVRGD